MINYIFIGGTYRGFRVLESLLKLGHTPQACFVLKEDKHEVLKYSSRIIDLAKANSIKYFLLRNLSEADYDYIKSNPAEFAVVCGWRTIIKPEIIKYFKYGLVAAHDSLLPKYRGFAPLNWAIINGEKETGVTLFLLNDGEADSGDIISQKKVLIEDNDYAIDVYEKITSATVELYRDFFDNYKRNAVVAHRQDHTQATYACRRTPEDGKIVWGKSSKEVFDLIRALAHPYPGAYCIYKEETYHIRKAELGESNDKRYSGSIPGRVIKTGANGIEVLCGKGTIEITEWENKNKKIIECPAQIIKSISDTLV